MVVLVNAFIYLSLIAPEKLSTKNLARIAGIALILTVPTIIIGGLHEKTAENETPLNVAVVQTNFPSGFSKSSNMERDKFLEITRLMFTVKNDTEKNEQEIDILILPEDSRFFSSIENASRSELVKDILGNDNSVVIDSGVKTEDGNLRSRLEYVSASGETRNSEKIFLMPFGEFLPYIILLPARIFGLNEWIDKFNETRKYSAGNGFTVAKFSSAKIGTLFCSEIISPNLYRRITNQGAELLVNVASQAVFNGSSALFKQTLNAAKVRAVENGRFFIQSSNHAPSFILDDKGRILKMSGIGENSVIYGKVSLKNAETPYAKTGDWILLLSALIILLTILQDKIFFVQNELDKVDLLLSTAKLDEERSSAERKAWITAIPP